MKRETLYNLLPEIYRYRDYYEGQQLRALMDVLEEVFDTLENEIEAGYENWFIETCETAAIPYIADLVHVKLGKLADLVPSDRRYVGNAIRNRRRKGTAEALQHVAAAATGWSVHVVEYRRFVSGTADLADARHSQPGVLDLRTLPAAAINHAFDTSPHNVALRRAHRRIPALSGGGAVPGQHGVHSIGLFVWRLASQLVNSAEPRHIGHGIYTVHPFGIDTPLFTAKHGPLEHLALARSLASGSYADLEIVVRDAAGMPFRRIEAPHIWPCDLNRFEPNSPGWENIELLIDPEHGRLLFPTPPHAVRVTCYSGFSAGCGGGSYERPVTPPQRAGTWEARVFRDAPANAPDTFPTLRGALAAWVRHGQRHGLDGVIRILDSGTYDERLPRLDLRDRVLAIEAGHGQYPTLLYGLDVRGRMPGCLTLDGLRIAGHIRIGGALAMAVRHSTIAPGKTAIVESAAAHSAVSVSSSILGSVALPHADFHAADSILDAGGSRADVLTAASVRIENCTVRGVVAAETLELASSSIFLGTLRIRDPSRGCVRYSFFPPRSAVPAEYACLDSRLEPRFTSLRYGDPGYCQLALNAAPEFTEGGEDNTELGAFRDLRQPARWRKLQTVIHEYVPFGLGCQVFYET